MKKFIFFLTILVLTAANSWSSNLEEEATIVLTFSDEGKSYFVGKGLIKADRFNKNTIHIKDDSVDISYVMIQSQPVHGAAKCFKGPIKKSAAILRRMLDLSSINFHSSFVQENQDNSITVNFRFQSNSSGNSFISTVRECKL